LDPVNDDVEYAAMADYPHLVSVPLPDRTVPARTVGPATLWALSQLAGDVAGLGAVAFRALIGIFQNLFFLGNLSAASDANMHAPAGPWGCEF
jgi:CIC family chloride channel protein